VSRSVGPALELEDVICQVMTRGERGAASFRDDAERNRRPKERVVGAAPRREWGRRIAGWAAGERGSQGRATGLEGTGEAGWEESGLRLCRKGVEKGSVLTIDTTLLRGDLCRVSRSVGPAFELEDVICQVLTRGERGAASFRDDAERNRRPKGPLSSASESMATEQARRHGRNCGGGSPGGWHRH
jgi:hypothetical protein